MRHFIRRILALSSLFVVAPGVALAHVGHGETAGFLYGFAHPVAGLDHVLAMVMVGVLAFQLGGRALWALPLTFVTVMAVGGVAGVGGVDLPFVETGIALSVIALGAMVAFGIRAPLAALMAVVGVFAVFHGHAHGAEMPETAAGLAYGVGFMLATALLHIAGIGVGALFATTSRTSGPIAVRSAGAVAAIAGIGLLIASL